MTTRHVEATTTTSFDKPDQHEDEIATMSSWMRRLAFLCSLANLFIFSFVFLWPGNCGDDDCLVPPSPATGEIKISCDPKIPTRDDNDAIEGARLYNCPIPRFSAVPLKLTALASRPCSGNTWVRHFVQQATGA